MDKLPESVRRCEALRTMPKALQELVLKEAKKEAEEKARAAQEQHVISTPYGVEDARRIAREQGWEWRRCVYLPWGHSEDLRRQHMRGIRVREDQLFGPFHEWERAMLTAGT
jgi:hypothetical protein